VKLLNRDHRVASPLYAEKLIGLRPEMMAEVGECTAMRGVLRLGVAETIVHTWLPRLIKSVNTTYPKAAHFHRNLARLPRHRCGRTCRRTRRPDRICKHVG